MRLAAEQIDHIVSATRELLGPQARLAFVLETVTLEAQHLQANDSEH